MLEFGIRCVVAIAIDIRLDDLLDCRGAAMASGASWSGLLIRPSQAPMARAARTTLALFLSIGLNRKAA